MQKEKNKKEALDASKMSDQDKRDLILSMRRLGGKNGNQKRAAPTTDDELWDWLYAETGDAIPRVAVCADHCAPFDFASDFYFERERALLVCGARESGKTKISAAVNYANAETKPGVTACVTGDTLIDCPRDHRIYPDGIPISQISPNQLVWTFSENKQIFELKRIIQSRITRKKAPIYKLELDTGNIIRSTSDHLYLKRDNQWVKMEELNIGDSLMPMYRDFEPFVRIRPDATAGGGRVSEYKAVADCKWPNRKGLDVDHIDDSRSNSSETNLQLLTASEHCKKTMTGRNVGFRQRQAVREQWTKKTTQEREEIAEKISKSSLERGPIEFTVAGVEGLRIGGAKGGSATMKSKEFICSGCGNKYWRKSTRINFISLCDKCKTEIRKCPICFEDFVVKRESRNKTCSRKCGQVLRHQVAAGNFNHKVKAIDFDGFEDVWDIEVEDNHNFVSCGIVLHNCVFADIEAQSNKSYSYIKSFVYTVDDNGNKVLKTSIDGEPLRKETRWKNGSIIEVIIGSKSGVNSPHTQKVVADEIDLMDEEIFMESRSISSSKVLSDGTVIKAQDIAASTRKTNKGLMQKLISEIDSAKKYGHKPPWKLYIFCIFENAQEVPNCRQANKEDREARLKELDKDPCELCECNRIAKGEWTEGVPRTLDSVCKGKFFKSRGWMRYPDIVGKFTQNSPQVWVAQMECGRPMADGLYLPTWSRERYCIRGYEPRPEYGLIWMGVDWGGSSQSISAVLWIQGPLHQPLQVNNTIGTKTVIPQGAYVIFKEINEASMGATRLADKVVRQEIQYKNRFGGSWRIKSRFADKAGAQQRADWREHNPPLRTQWYLSGSYLDPTIECLQSIVADSLLYVDDQQCPGTCDDFESWRSAKGQEVHDSSSHNPAAARYCLKNVSLIMKRNSNITNRETLQPVVVGRDAAQNIPGALAAAAIGSSIGQAEYESETWRRSMGAPVSAGDLSGRRGGSDAWRP